MENKPTQAEALKMLNDFAEKRIDNSNDVFPIKDGIVLSKIVDGLLYEYTFLYLLQCAYGVSKPIIVPPPSVSHSSGMVRWPWQSKY